MSQINERGSTHVYKVSKMSKEDMDGIINLCVYEQSAYCSAACPLKVDAKAMLEAVADGDLKKALSIYEKAVPFPRIVSAGCSAPCESRCRLGERGEAVSIREIERALSKYAPRSASGGVFRMKKRKTAAIFGCDLFCLLLAGELEKKMYPLTVFCEEENIEDYLRNAAPFLEDEDFAAELEHLKRLDISFAFSASLAPDSFREKAAGFDVVCAACGVLRAAVPDAVCSRDIMLCESERVVMGPAGFSVLEAAFDAKRAALSVDRLAQGLDSRNTRGEEGAVETKLYTNLDDARELSRIPCGESGYSAEEAQREAQRCIQCRCEECFRGCAYLRYYKKHPGLLGREIFNNTQIIMGDHQLNKPMNSCSLCGQCAVTCPNGFDMAKVCLMARRNMVSTDKMPLAPHEFALLDMLFSNSEAFLSRPQPGREKCKHVFFPGCQACAIAPQTVRAAYEDLCARLDGGVALMLGCCGEIAEWAGRTEMAESTRAFIDREMAKLGDPTVIAGCPSCYKQLSTHEGLRVTGIWDVLNDIGLPQGAAGLDRPAALHDSCGARGNEQMQGAIRQLAESLGCTLAQTPLQGDASPCCGYGGLTLYANREVAGEMARSCLDRSELPYISYCMACRDRFAREGRESRHILELVYGKIDSAPPDISEKRRNRLVLKEEMLMDIWGENVRKKPLGFKLEYTPEARRRMDERMILQSDVEQVMSLAIESGQAVCDTESGLLTAMKRIGNVSFWVKYTHEDGVYTVHSAYSHRMNVVRRV